MIQKQVGDFTLLIHDRTNFGLRHGNFIVNGIPYSVHTHYLVGEGLALTEDFRHVSRTDTWQKEATHEQKNRVCNIINSLAVDMIFAHRELLEEAHIEAVKAKRQELIAKREKLYAEADALTKQIKELVS